MELGPLGDSGHSDTLGELIGEYHFIDKKGNYWAYMAYNCSMQNLSLCRVSPEEESTARITVL
jgi:hypothetical protein